jgi:DNA-binding beta-propeller fold protein YncE
MDRAAGGEILVTDTVRQLAGTMPGTRFRDRARVALKGFPERQRLYAVEPAEGAIPTRAPPRNRPRRSRRPLVAAGGDRRCGRAGGHAGAEAVDVLPDHVAVLDPEEGRVVAQVPVGGQPADLAVPGGSVWVSNRGDDTVTRIGARSHRVMGTDSPGIDLDGLGAGPSGVWVADAERGLARVLDPAFRTVARTYPIERGGPDETRPVAVTREAVWVSHGHGLMRLDPLRKRVDARIPLGNSPSGVAVRAGGVWVSDDLDGTVSRIDPAPTT